MKTILLGVGITAMLIGCSSSVGAEQGKDSPGANASGLQTAVFAVS